MNKEEYLEQIKTQTGLAKKDIEAVIETFLEILKQKLVKEQKASITNFGTFRVVTTKPYEFFSPVDGRKMKTKGISKVFFTSSKELKNRISGD